MMIPGPNLFPCPQVIPKDLVCLFVYDLVQCTLLMVQDKVGLLGSDMETVQGSEDSVCWGMNKSKNSSAAEGLSLPFLFLLGLVVLGLSEDMWTIRSTTLLL